VDILQNGWEDKEFINSASTVSTISAGMEEVESEEVER